MSGQNKGNSLLTLHDTLLDAEEEIKVIVKTNKKIFFIKKLKDNLFTLYEGIESSIISLKLLLHILSLYKIMSIYIFLNYNRTYTIYPKKIERSNSI